MDGRGARRHRCDVEFVDAAPETAADIDAAYHAKYDQFGVRIVATVVGEQAHPLTLQLVPPDGSP